MIIQRCLEGGGGHVCLHLKKVKNCLHLNTSELDFPGGAVVKNLPANAGDMGSIPVPGRSHMSQSN